MDTCVFNEVPLAFDMEAIICAIITSISGCVEACDGL